MTEHERDIPAEDAQVLSSADAAALDALIDARLDPSRAVGGDPERIRRAAGLLHLLASGERPDPSLADATMARVLRARRYVAVAQGGTEALSPDDEAALESWIMHGYDASRVAPSLRERARRHERLANLATSASVDADGSIVDRTLARIQRFEDETSEARRLPAARRRGLGVRLADLASVAAVVLIGAGLVLPVLSAVREQARRAACLTNLGSTASAMSSYAHSNRDSLPMATASLGGGHWWDVGSPRSSNSANLYTLARDGYVTLATLACPGNPSAPTRVPSPDARDWRRLEEISYSYQIMFGPRPAWNGPHRVVILADRSPVVLRAVRGERPDPMANAPNHQGAGQHLLVNDASVSWAGSPVLPNGDNIWLPRHLEVRSGRIRGTGLSGRELPAGPDDTCLGP